MGMTLYVAADRELPDADLNNDRTTLPKLLGEPEMLETLSRRLGVRSLADFQSYEAEQLAQYVDDDEIRQKILNESPPLEWFDPNEALLSVRALLAHYAS